MVIKLEKEKTNKLYANLKKYIKLYLFDVLFISLLLVIVFYEAPYVIYQPGGAINLSERIEVENDYKNKGSYSMNYVSVARGKLPIILASYLIDDWDLVKQEEITFEHTDYQTTFKIEQLDYKNSLDVATMTAYKKAGIEVENITETGTVIYIAEDAKTDMKLLDEIVSVNGKTFKSVSEAQEYIQSIEIGKEIKIKVKNQGKEYERTAIPYELDGRKVVGVSLISNYSYEVNPKINIKTKSSEAGSSGGLMLTLAIYDELMEKDYTHGKNIMGTGTIDINGNVGPISGVKYKMLGAQKTGADVFFIPEENYKEAKKVYKKHKLDFKLVCVKTLDEAIAYLEKLS